MDEENNNQTYDLESIMAEFRSMPAEEYTIPEPEKNTDTEPEPEEKAQAVPAEPSAEQSSESSQRLVMRSIADAFGEEDPAVPDSILQNMPLPAEDREKPLEPPVFAPAAFHPPDDGAAQKEDVETSDTPRETEPIQQSETEEPPAPEPAVPESEEEEEEDIRIWSPGQHSSKPVPSAQAAPAVNPEPQPFREDTLPRTPALTEAEIQALLADDENSFYGVEEESESPETESTGKKTGEKKESLRQRILSPFLSLMAMIALRMQQWAGGEHRKPTEDAETEDAELPEPDADKAAKHYGAQMGSLLLRGRLSTAVCLVMLYLSIAYYSPVLPLTGALNNGIRALCMLLLILESTVIVIGLDIFTGGLLAIYRRKMGAESLVSISCVLSILDALVLGLVNKPDYGIPFCAVSAISLCFAIWGAYYTCKGRRNSFRVLASAKSHFTVSAERGLTPDDLALLKSTRTSEGFIRRSEEADAGEYAYGLLTPFLLAAALILGLAASLLRGQAGSVLHCVSILVASTATFSCTICFSVPFSSAARKLSQSGAAIAGWSGLRDIGSGRYVVITDKDVFPRGTVEIDKVRILEGAFTDKVISYTGSLIAASGSELVLPFADLIRRNGYSVRRVDHFEAHDGGGMTGMVNGERVYVGGSGFMNLMGIRLPQRLNTQSSIFAAINGSLVGIFTIDYHPTASVQNALVLLLHSKLEPIFAIRDFNITPSMIQSKYKLSTDNFKFPSYTERFRISAAEPDKDSRVSAVITRDGMGPLVDVAERGRRLLFGVRAATAVSVVGSIFGLIILFLLCWSRAFDSATVSNVITFMLLWLLPIVLIIFGLER